MGDEKPAVDLSAVPLSALTSEIKRRRDEWESAQKDLVGFGVAPAAPVVQRARYVGKAGVKAQTTGSAVISAAKKLYWAKRQQRSKTEIAELERAVEQAKAANLREKQASS